MGYKHAEMINLSAQEMSNYLGGLNTVLYRYGVLVLILWSMLFYLYYACQKMVDTFKNHVDR